MQYCNLLRTLALPNMHIGTCHRSGARPIITHTVTLNKIRLTRDKNPEGGTTTPRFHGGAIGEKIESGERKLVVNVSATEQIIPLLATGAGPRAGAKKKKK
jgi:hypothetical protein